MHIRLIDAAALGCANPQGRSLASTPAGTQAQAIAGVLDAVRHKLERAPDVLNVLVWDGRAQWRHDLLPGYKGPHWLAFDSWPAGSVYVGRQPPMRKALGFLPVVQVSHPGAEAVDVAWGLSRQLSRQGHLVTMEAESPDWLQAVAERVSWQNPRGARQTVELQGFFKSSGYLTPQAVSHTRALTGDASAGIDGAPDIGLKRATGLVSKYRTVQALIAATQDFVGFSQEPSYTHALMTVEVQERILRNLALMGRSEGPVLDGADCTVAVGDWDTLEFYDLLVDLGVPHEPQQFAPWQKIGQKPVPASGAQTIERALERLSLSWTDPS